MATYLDEDSEEWLTASGVSLARAIRERAISSLELTNLHIRRIQEVNPTINAVVADRFAMARVEAIKADDAADRGEWSGPYHGVPCTIKECFALTGMPNAAGLVARKDVIAERDATAVERMRAAGAIPMGVTNTSELCMWMESSNRLYGRTSNPYNTNHIVGGSSGGEGAIIASGGSPFGLGSDIGGSIRLPAFFTGVFGHKPTGTMVPGTGQYPISEGDALRYLTTGPLCRSAEDLMPLLEVMAGPDGEDEMTASWLLGDPDAVEFEGMNVVVVQTNGLRKVNRELLEAQDRVADVLRRKGARVHHVEIPGLKKSLEVWSQKLSAAGGTPFRELLENGDPKSLKKELVKWLLRRSDHTFPAIALAGLEDFPLLVPSDLQPMVDYADTLKDEIVDRIGTGGVMLYPPYTRPAPRHMYPMATPIDWTYTAIFNALENPVTQVPVGFSSNGLPLGVQVVGIHGEDHVPIAVALEVERQLGGWVPPWHR